MGVWTRALSQGPPSSSQEIRCDQVLLSAPTTSSTRSRSAPSWRGKRRRGARNGRLRSSLRLRTSPWQLFPVPTLTQANVPLTWRSCARSQAVCLGGEEGRQVLGVENQEHNRSKKIKRGAKAEGKSDRSASGFPGEGERQLEEGCGGSQRCPCASKDGGGNFEGEDGEV